MTEVAGNRSPLDGNEWVAHASEMDWLSNMKAWQALPEENRRDQAWAQVPQSVAASMAFEGEPVDPTWLEKIHRRTEIPALSNPAAAFSPTRS